jgi:hypothetical protein
MDAYIADELAPVYRDFPPLSRGPLPPPTIKGSTLAYRWLRGKGPVQRAIIAAYLADRELALENPTHRQLALVCGANENYMARALALSPQERAEAMRSGILPTTHADLARTIGRAGVDEVWDVLATRL